MVVGLTLKVTLGGGGFTVNNAVAVAVPLLLVAETVYVVVAVGLTDNEPDAPTGPMPGLMLTADALLVDHVSRAEPPRVIVAGVTAAVTVGGGDEGT